MSDKQAGVGPLSRNIEVTVTWAPADGARMLLERAASMLTGYGELIRRDGASHVEEHHYLPEVEHVAAELRALMDATPRTCGQLGVAVVDAIADDGLRNAAGGIYATRVQEFATEVQRAFAEQNGLQIRGLTLGA